MLLQANDFRHLYEHHGVELQAGGSDQWGNIVAGVDLIRRRLGQPAHALTHPLMLKSDGAKFGKSVGGAVWLDPARTSPYQFRQFWMQTDDDDGRRLPADALDCARSTRSRRLLAEHAAAPERRLAQRALADEMTDAGARRRGGRQPPTRPPTCCSAAIPTPASEAALAAVAAEVPSSRRPAGELDDLVTNCWSASGLAPRTARCAALLDQGAGTAATAPCSTAESELCDASTCSRALPAAAQGRSDALPRRGFPDQGLTRRDRCDSVALRSTDGVSSPRRARHQAGSSHRRGRAASFGSLKTEEKTERQCGQFVGGGPRASATTACQFMSPGSPPGDNTDVISQIVRAAAEKSMSCPRARQPVVRHRTATAGDRRQVFVGEFDPGSGRTLAACLTHASRTRSSQ